MTDSLIIRRAFRAGLCPCCFSPLFGWTAQDGTEYEPAPIAEGVMLCGRCIGNRHQDEAAETVLKALAE